MQQNASIMFFVMTLLPSESELIWIVRHQKIPTPGPQPTVSQVCVGVLNKYHETAEVNQHTGSLCLTLATVASTLSHLGHSQCQPLSVKSTAAHTCCTQVRKYSLYRTNAATGARMQTITHRQSVQKKMNRCSQWWQDGSTDTWTQLINVLKHQGQALRSSAAFQRAEHWTFCCKQSVCDWHQTFWKIRERVNNDEHLLSKT